MNAYSKSLPARHAVASGSPDEDGPAGAHLSDAAFARVAEIAHRVAGLYIAPGKAAMVRTRLARRLRALGLQSYEAYCALVESPDGADELIAMISALTTNVSQFFREDHHFDMLRTEVLPPLLEKARQGARVRLWSAGCSNGQEPYSIAMTLLDAGLPNNHDIKILATDIDPVVVDHARNGWYPEAMLTGLAPPKRAAHFTAMPARGEPGWRANDDLQSLVSFRVLNLLHVWPMRGAFDVVFCRNVVIYFDSETQDRLWGRFSDVIPEGGWMLLGHSERVGQSHQQLFEKRGVTAYQRSARKAQ